MRPSFVADVKYAGSSKFGRGEVCGDDPLQLLHLSHDVRRLDVRRLDVNRDYSRLMHSTTFIHMQE
jgi:hypothetical protein